MIQYSSMEFWDCWSFWLSSGYDTKNRINHSTGLGLTCLQEKDKNNLLVKTRCILDAKIDRTGNLFALFFDLF